MCFYTALLLNVVVRPDYVNLPISDKSYLKVPCGDSGLHKHCGAMFYVWVLVLYVHLHDDAH